MVVIVRHVTVALRTRQAAIRAIFRVATVTQPETTRLVDLVITRVDTDQKICPPVMTTIPHHRVDQAYEEPDDSEITTQPRADAYEHDYSMGKADNTVTEDIAEKAEEEQEEQEEVHETALELTEDNIEVANVEEEEPIAEPQEEEEQNSASIFLFSIDEVDDAPSRRPYASTLSSSSAKHEDVEEVEEVPKTTVQQRESRENKIAFKAPTEDSSEPRRIKSPIENIVPKKRVSDLIARFNAGDAGRGDAWKNKDESGGGKSVGKLQPTVFH
ncbi:unnamed protein product [Nippostrongylus brasiliensis]|uniref:CaM_binding domain-containing protein n=1 Tax=Nippostrongylus brasiliensis TaxID=27835 RepID=A0A0N4XXE6_NIPBR|nr:unnamed protein product [Nippostrongylus brasiliensis]